MQERDGGVVLNRKEAVGDSDKDAPCDAHQVGDETALVFRAADMLQYSVRGGDVKRIVRERQRLVGDDLLIAHSGKRRAELLSCAQANGCQSIRVWVSPFQDICSASNYVRDANVEDRVFRLRVAEADEIVVNTIPGSNPQPLGQGVGFHCLVVFTVERGRIERGVLIGHLTPA